MRAGSPQMAMEGGELRLRWPSGQAWEGLTARCRLRDGTWHEGDGWSSRSGRWETRCGPLHVSLVYEASGSTTRLRVEAVAEADVEVTAVAIAARPTLTGSAPVWLLHNGYQSWDAAGRVVLDCVARDSWWTVVLTDERGAGIAAVAEAATTSCTKFAIEGGRLSVMWRETEALEPWPLLFRAAAGSRWRGEAVRIGGGPDACACLSSLLGRPPRPGPVPIGWLTWYHHGPFIKREDLLANAERLGGPEFRRLGYRLVQLDDGWQEAYGEWRPNQKFREGLAALVAELAEQGLAAGLWTAPFLVSAAADLARSAPDDWFIRDPTSGERAIDPRQTALGPMYVLDPSRPGVREHLRELYASFYDAGIRYFKADFLYAGGYAGARALRAGLEAIREGAKDAPILASGAPMLPVVGLVEGCRVGPDTATPVPNFDTGTSSPTVFGDEVYAVARNLAARWPLHHWYWPDADIALVGGNLTLEQGRQLATLAALSGGPFFASDDLVALPPERLALLTNPEVLGLVGGGPAIPDWEPYSSDRPPTHWRRGDVLAIFNWENSAAKVPIRAPSSRGARDLWARDEIENLGEDATIDIPASGVRLLRLH